MADQLQEYAVMVLCAADVDEIWHIATADGAHPQSNPVLPAAASDVAQRVGYINDRNFRALAQLRCNDLYIAKTNNVYYGLVLVALQPVGPIAAGDMLIAVRGTMNDLEWLNDITALTMIAPRPAAIGLVGEGFWKIYESMALADFGGAVMPGDLPTRLLQMADSEGCSKVFVCGHSLGAALATYLAFDLCRALGRDNAARLRPYFFASPKTGTSDWVTSYQRALGAYDLCNYSLDFVPMVPPDGDTLLAGSGGHNVHIIAALSPGALDTRALFAKWDAAKNHSPIGYARMLDQSNETAKRLLAAGT